MMCPKCGARLYRDGAMTDDGPVIALVCWAGHTVSYRDHSGATAVPITENLPRPTRRERSDSHQHRHGRRFALLPVLRLDAVGIDVPDDLPEVPD